MRCICEPLIIGEGGRRRRCALKLRIDPFDRFRRLLRIHPDPALNKFGKHRCIRAAPGDGGGLLKRHACVLSCFSVAKYLRRRLCRAALTLGRNHAARRHNKERQACDRTADRFAGIRHDRASLELRPLSRIIHKSLSKGTDINTWRRNSLITESLGGTRKNKDSIRVLPRSSVSCDVLLRE